MFCCLTGKYLSGALSSSDPTCPHLCHLLQGLLHILLTLARTSYLFFFLAQNIHIQNLI